MLLHQLRPQVVLLDHALPAGPGARFRSGLELARHMAQIGPAQSTPALLLTGHDLAAIAGPDAVPPGTPCLRKPVPREVLLAEVRLRLAMAPPRPVQVMLAHGDPAWRAVAANLAADTRLAFAFEANNASCIETLRLRARAFDAVVLESPATAAELSDLLRSLRALESVPPLLVLADAALQAHAGLWAELREPPVTGVLPRSPLLADPSHLRARLLALGSAEDPSAGRAAA
jgi:CheY-like chemotaxis protein